MRERDSLKSVTMDSGVLSVMTSLVKLMLTLSVGQSFLMIQLEVHPRINILHLVAFEFLYTKCARNTISAFVFNT